MIFLVTGDGNVSFEEFVEIVSNIGGANTMAWTDKDQEEQELKDAFKVSSFKSSKKWFYWINDFVTHQFIVENTIRLTEKNIFAIETKRVLCEFRWRKSTRQKGMKLIIQFVKHGKTTEYNCWIHNSALWLCNKAGGL